LEELVRQDSGVIVPVKLTRSGILEAEIIVSGLASGGLKAR